MSVCDVPLMDVVCDTVTGAGAAVTDGIGAWVAKSIGELAASAVDLAAGSMDATTRVDLNAGWFRDNYELLLPIGLVLTVGTFCLQLIAAAWRRDERALARAVSGTVIGVFFAFAAISVTTVALAVVDALSAGLFQVANSSVEDAVRRLVKVSALGAMFPLGWAVPALVGLGCAVGAFLYWGVMIFRKVGILILVTLAPFAGAGGGWEAAKKWRRGWIEATATLVVSKLLMTIVFLVGVSAIGKSETGDGLAAVSDAIAGIVVMVLVLLCPYATYKFVHWAADSGAEDAHRAGGAGLATAGRAARTAGDLATRGGLGGRAPQGPAQLPGAGQDGVASGINPTGLDETGMPITPAPKQTKFRFGEDPDASGDKGRPLLQRPPTDGDKGQPLLRRASQGGDGGGSSSSDGSEAPSTPVSPSVPTDGFAPTAGRSPTPGGSASPPAPPPHGSETPKRWVYPDEPTGSSGS